MSYPTPSSHAPSSPPILMEAESSQSKLKWYKKINPKNLGRGGHPYTCQAISFYDGPHPSRIEDVKFWPFVGPLVPWRTPTAIDKGWESYEGTAALCINRKLVIGRCTDEDPWKVLWELEIDDSLFTAAWTYHPFTCHPLLAVAGNKGLIHIIDAISKKCIRVLKGHGGDILCVTFHPLNPHILASTSYDKSTRIWNILGSDTPKLPQGVLPNENYPMGDADQGNCLITILAGEGKGGHRGYVSWAAFHPTKNAIATAGLDRQVKIWPLFEFPEPSFKPVPTPRGYRAKIIYVPMFSTSRLHFDFVDYIEWLDEHILITRQRQQVAIWQWLGFSRYFGSKDASPLNMDSTSRDYDDSGSFLPITIYSFGADNWAMNPSLHRQFAPTTEEAENLKQNENLVTDPLMALVAHRGDTHLPELLLINPLLARDGDPPLPIMEKRFKTRREDEIDEQKKTKLTLQQRRKQIYDKQRMLDGHNDNDDNDDDDDDDSSMIEEIPYEKAIYQIDKEIEEENENIESRNENMIGDRNKTLEPWRLIASDFRSINQSLARRGRKIYKGNTNLCNVSISPRGAKWIIGVGEPSTIFVWKNDSTPI
ncbi:uncharacterized protein L201_007903 [Kwoniella dendrophila CBS 6074]|uniref:Polycomb protein EED n=1 Tax=Kwoniella dendrophila CBS 6074 TaxID=1295534 RepID=A0AAX4K7V9_9TREE